MKKLLTFIMACVISLGVTAQISKEAFEKWHQNKYSMSVSYTHLTLPTSDLV